ncbi:DEAD/DEAH box helicase [Geodermatophilus sp. TF02-6]|uniref:EcoAI/FtnUII family type I restriction enzme subunit R n=1 Tax=Geodermatophilus sp. TF02-6 TaxID=2250575 RepID=UPI000DE8DEFB|nr:DEAD/DEAH box helicase family protein [Geodermatophilus sp. TF02-6]RBY79803.1 DEAD/DEAH box helicase [Geodermatophilus sp. TF02-6]
MTAGGPDEADTCRDHVRPALARAGWVDEQIHEQYPVQAELPGGRRPPEGQRKRRADYVLELEPGLPLMVVEAKRLWALPGDGIQQAVRYARRLGAPLALSTNGRGWVLYDAATGVQHEVDDVPTPEEAWDLLVSARELGELAQQYLRSPFNRQHLNADGSVKELRYYQRRAIHEVLLAIVRGERRVLLVMATGSGKTFTALQLVWKLWSHRRRVQAARDERNYRVLYLADRDVLVTDPMRKNFQRVFGDAVVRVSSRNTRHSPDVYFATYQGLTTASPDSDVSADTAESRELLTNYPPDFFDLVIVDECHRGSARADSEWRGILEHFDSAVQLGLTATPVDRNGAHTYEYFGNPVYTYSLREGIEDGFLAPYTIRRVVFDVDAEGFDVPEGLRDIHGREIPGGTYGTRDYERRLRLPDRTSAMARRIVEVLGDSRDRAVVFCVDKEHALTMTEALRNLRPDRTREDPEWAVRIMSVEREKDRLLEQFTDPERDVPQIAVTSSLLSTGVDIEDLRYVILARPVGSMPEFKQIIGRGTRLYPDKGKTEFEIVDFVGATELFRDPSFDGPPLRSPSTECVSPSGEVRPEPDGGEERSGDDGQGPAPVIGVAEPEPEYAAGGSSETGRGDGNGGGPPRDTFELRGISVTLTSEGFWVHDVTTGGPRLVRYVDWARQRVLETFDEPETLLRAWSDPRSRADVVSFLGANRIDPVRLTDELERAGDGRVDTIDRLLHLAWGLPVLTCAERARRARSQHREELDALPERAREILGLLLDRYAEAGVDEIAAPSVVQVPPLSAVGSPAEIAGHFGGARQWHRARETLQAWLYSA